MARQSLRKRRPRYKERIQQEFDHYQQLLRRQEIRLHRGDYHDRMDRKRRSVVSNLIRSALPVLPHGYKVIINGPSALNKVRRTYFKICRILRIAGNPPPQFPKRTQVILRKHEPPESESI